MSGNGTFYLCKIDKNCSHSPTTCRYNFNGTHCRYVYPYLTTVSSNRPSNENGRPKPICETNPKILQLSISLDRIPELHVRGETYRSQV